MGIYFILAICPVLISLAARNLQKILTILFLFFTFFVSAIRFEVGYDYNDYLLTINEINDGNIHRTIEPSFYLISKFVHIIGLSNEYVFVIYSIISGLCFYFLFKKVRFHPNFLYFFIFFSNFYLQSLNQIRNFVAILLIWLAILNYKNIYVFLICSLLAIFFHYSALFVIPIFFFLSKNIRIYNKIIILLIAFFLVNLFSQFTSSIFIYKNYFNENNNQYQYTLFFGIFISWIYLELHQVTNEYNYLRNLSFICILSIVMMFLLRIQSDLLYRYSYYFMIFLPLIFSAATIDSKLEKKIKSFFCICFMPLIFLYTLETKGELYHLVPYKTFFNIF
jgi:hypothetical protein